MLNGPLIFDKNNDLFTGGFDNLHKSHVLWCIQNGPVQILYGPEFFLMFQKVIIFLPSPAFIR
jgi:hypothetical protein